jgi:hypothetical protein
MRKTSGRKRRRQANKPKDWINLKLQPQPYPFQSNIRTFASFSEAVEFHDSVRKVTSDLDEYYSIRILGPMALGTQGVVSK